LLFIRIDFYKLNIFLQIILFYTGAKRISNLFFILILLHRAKRDVEKDIEDIFGDTDSELSSDDEDDDIDLDEEEEQEQPPPRRVRTRGGKQQLVTSRKPNEWKSWEDAPLIPDCPRFTEDPGPTIQLPEKAFEFVKIFLTDELINLIVKETNRYADQFLQRKTLTPNARAQDWKPVTYNVRKPFYRNIYPHLP